MGFSAECPALCWKTGTNAKGALESGRPAREDRGKSSVCFCSSQGREWRKKGLESKKKKIPHAVCSENTETDLKWTFERSQRCCLCFLLALPSFLNPLYDHPKILAVITCFKHVLKLHFYLPVWGAACLCLLPLGCRPDLHSSMKNESLGWSPGLKPTVPRSTKNLQRSLVMADLFI